MSIPIYLFTDYRKQFYSSTKFRGAAVDLKKLEYFFTEKGFTLIVGSFDEIDFRKQNYKNQWVLYQSSEDPSLFYKSYIEDMVTGLFIQGARLIPNLFQFKAHHNKNFMEIMRDLQPLSEIKNIRSDSYGTYEDYLSKINRYKEGVFVLKTSATSKSRGVFRLGNEKEKIKLPKTASKTFSFKNFLYYIEFLKTGCKPLLISNHRMKFIVQPYVADLEGDYRIVVYGEKFYILYRRNRVEDFRASGSMKFDFNITPPDGIFNYARRIFESFNVPFIALDIAFKNGEFYLFEFQFLSFGQYTSEKSSFYYHYEKNMWKKIMENPDLEREIAASVILFINKSKNLCAE